ncbi:hypothetical protein F0562_035704 [Nyssa sinensis]|uniref:PPC domain-containing protein n=1 Tax=Nyssa sinensis TaxID=561372 RepID=A0A5J5ADN7_9ASTE|nr:hypothetical protein F0562_035704 [Nyssa sinensis]
MFTKLHQTQKFQQQPLHPNHAHHHFQVARECQTSEEADSRSSGGATPTITATPTTNTKKEHNCDGATIEVVRRPRGRPPGSKNKPKPPVIITRDTEPSMNPYVLELPGGVDVVDAISRFCRKRNTGLCVLTASGTVANVTLRQPSVTPGATVTFHGRFDILSLSATILPTTTSLIMPPLANGFAISLAGPQEDDMRNSASGGNDQSNSPPTVSGGGDSGHPPAGAESCGMPIYSCHLPSDVIWAPTARQPQPPY